MNALQECTNHLVSQLQSGPFEIMALTGLSCIILVPITQYMTRYGFTVGYGLCVGWLGLCLWKAFFAGLTRTNHLLLVSVVFYGLRLGGYIFLRDLNGWRPHAAYKESHMSRFKRIPFALALSLLYSCMTAPVVYALRAPARGPLATFVATTGVIVACVAALLEAIADAHKHMCKQGLGSSKGEFVGPSSGLYSITRHPNYTAEIAFWTGIWLAGMPSFGFNLVAWICCSVGLFSIVMIMIGSTRRLEDAQQAKYGGQRAYEAWKQLVPSPLIPGMHAITWKGFY